jgi:hypothetical protein
VHSCIGRSHFAMMELDLLSPWLVGVVKAPIDTRASVCVGLVVFNDNL